MASASIQLTDLDGLVTGSATVVYGGEGDGKATFSSDLNEGLDREGNATFRTTTGSPAVSENRKVTQEGMREKFNASDGEFWVKNEEGEYDGGTFHVLKGYGYEVGDILFCNEELGRKVVIPYEAWNRNKSDYPVSRYTPIGVVVIPSSHDVYGTGECAVMSLKYMSCSNPNEGSTSDETICWGYNSLLLGDALNVAAYTGTCDAPGSDVVGTTSDPYLPSDNFNAKACPTDPKAYYYYDSSSYRAAPSPYLEDGSRNPVYYQTESPSSELNCLADFDGVGKTQLILDAVTVSDWKTSSTIADSYSEGNYPSACCCWRYHTEGTEQGDWYLPACGEAGYMVARRKKLDETITALIGEYGNTIGGALVNGAYWSSSEYSDTNARYVDTYYGYVNSIHKYYTNYVRAFLRF